MRAETSTYLTTGLLLAVAATLGVAAFRRFDHPAQAEQFVISPPDIGPEIEPSSSSISREPPPPPEGPFYASLFVAGATWTLPCRLRDKPIGTQRCRVESVEVAGQRSTARIGCWYVDQGETPHPAVNTYVMTPSGLYKAEATPDLHGVPMFTPHPIAKGLPRRWGLDEPLQPTWAHAMVHHHGAWCSISEFQSEDASAEFAECISRRGIVGVTQRFNIGPAEHCGDVPD